MKRAGIVSIFSIIFLLGLAVYHGVLKVDLALLQLFLMPVVLLLVAAISIVGVRIPRAILFCSAAIAVLCFLYTHWSLTMQEKPYFVARLEGDKFDAQTRVLTARLNEILLPISGFEAESIYQDFKQKDDAEAYLENHRGVRAVVWGSKKRLNISFQKDQDFVLSPANSSSLFLRFYGLKLVSSVHWFDISYEPFEGVRQFLGHVLAGYISLSDHGREAKSTRAVFRQKHLLHAAGYSDFWRSLKHRGLPYWLSANYLFVEALQYPEFRKELFKTIRNRYVRAASFVRFKENPELKAAIYNNLGVSYFIRSQIVGKKRMRKLAIKYLKKAAAIDRKKSNVKDMSAVEDARAVSGVARENMGFIHQFVLEKKKGSQERKRKGAEKTKASAKMKGKRS